MKNNPTLMRTVAAKKKKVLRSPKLGDTSLIFRVLNQSMFDQGNDGGCQTAAVLSAIEAKFRVAIPYREMKRYYTEMDNYWNRRGEKLARVLAYMQFKGVRVSGVPGGKVYANDYGSLAPKDLTFDQVVKAVETYDFVGISLNRFSPFFSNISGKFDPSVKLPGGHAMRIVRTETKGGKPALRWQNSWGLSWGQDGTCYITEDDFDDLKVTELKFCNFYVAK